MTASANTLPAKSLGDRFGSPCSGQSMPTVGSFQISGIRKIPHLSTLLPEFHICKDGKGAEAVVGWGLRPTTHKARAFAAEHQLPFIALEDGFLRSLGLGVARLSALFHRL